MIIPAMSLGNFIWLCLVGEKTLWYHIRYFMKCRERCLDTNKKLIRELTWKSLAEFLKSN
jgi:hypothetical protein